MNPIYTITWENHRDTIEWATASILRRQGKSDCTLTVEQQEIPAHKAILVSCSYFFQSLTEAEFHENKNINMDYNTMQLVLQFMYEGKVRVFKDAIGPLVKAAQNLGIKGLMGLRESYFKNDDHPQQKDKEIHVHCNGDHIKIEKNVIEKDKQRCWHCNKQFYSKTNMRKHTKICNRVYRTLINATTVIILL